MQCCITLKVLLHVGRRYILGYDGGDVLSWMLIGCMYRYVGLLLIHMIYAVQNLVFYVNLINWSRYDFTT